MSMYEMYLVCVMVNLVVLAVATVVRSNDVYYETFRNAGKTNKSARMFLISSYVMGIISSFTGPLCTLAWVFSGVCYIVMRCTKRGRGILDLHKDLKQMFAETYKEQSA